MRRAARRPAGAIRRSGAWLAVLPLCAAPLLAQGPERTVTGLHFRGNAALDDYTLATSISTSASGWAYRVPVLKHLGLGQRRYFDELEFRRDVLRLQLLYRLRGYYDARIDTVVSRSDNAVDISFLIDEGAPVRLDSVAVAGTDSVMDERDILRRLSFRVGQPFDRLAFEGAADTIALLLRDRGHPFVQVYRNFVVDRVAHRAEVRFDVAPGPAARVGEVRIDGADGVSAATVARSLAVHDGDRFRQTALYESQRSLYETGLFRFVSVEVAADSTVGGVDSLVRIQVRVSEGPHNRYRIGAGYGTIDCFRTQGSWTAGGFLGGTRRLDFAAKLSKLGVGSPTRYGLENSVCPALAEDTAFSSHVNYLTSVSFTQPALFARRNALTLSAFAERRSEFKVYERLGLGGSAAMTFGVGRDIPLTVSYRLSYGRTIADAASFCTFFDRCEQSTITLLSERRREAAIVVTATRNRANSPIEPTSGDFYSLEFTHASPLIGSDSLIVFNKIVGEAAWYEHPFGPRTWVLALRLRGGVIRPGLAFVADSNIRFVPPEERFYAGGPTTVRGFGRNEMGPVVYVADSVRTNPDGSFQPYGLRTSPVGSYAVVLGNAELRFPSPIWPSRLRMAAFVDVGRLWDQTEAGLVSAGFRVTPGFGVRIMTPLGPLRVDAAYNDYPRQTGPLYSTEQKLCAQPGCLTLLDEHYGGPPRRQTFFGKLQFHFSVGEAY